MVLTKEAKPVALDFRRHTLLPLANRLYALQPGIARLSMSALHRCSQR